MQTYDILMIGVLVGTAAFGFMKGMAWQIASLASLIVSYFVSLRFNAQLAPIFGDSEPWNKYVAMLVIYIACSFFIWVGFRFVSSTIDRVKLKEFDRQMGALFGIAKGILFCIAITFFAATLLPDDRKAQVLASRSGEIIGRLLEKAEAIVPPEYQETVRPFLHNVNEKINPDHIHEGEVPGAIDVSPSGPNTPSNLPNFNVNIENWSIDPTKAKQP